MSWRPQGFAVPAAVRGVFVRAATAGFAGFAVPGLFTAISPSFVGQVLHIGNHLVTGLVVFTLFGASTLGQAVSTTMSERPALLTGCVGLVVGVSVVGLGVALASLALLAAGAAVAGAGQA